MSAANRAPLKLAILISGRGSNMTAIARACLEKAINARVEVVISGDTLGSLPFWDRTYTVGPPR